MTTYRRPTSKAEALAVLAEHGPDARPLVGGTDLLVGLRHHTVDPRVIIDLKRIEDLPPAIEVTDDHVRIGPTATMGDLTRHPAVRRSYPSLIEAALTVGSVAIRNRASLIGNVCNGSPAADTVPSMLVHDATVTIESTEGSRTVALPDFFLGPRRTACGPGELVTRLDLRLPSIRYGSSFQRLTRRRGVDLATVSVAAGVDERGRTVLGLGAVGPTALRTVLPRPVDPDRVDDLASELDQELDVATPITDIRGGRRYRLAMLRVLARRAVETASRRCHEEVA